MAVDQQTEAKRLFAIEVAIGELVIVTERHSVHLIARYERLENTVMTKLADIETKIDRLDTMLDAKAASDDADLDALGTKLDGVIAKHTPADATVNVETAIDPVTGLPVA